MKKNTHLANAIIVAGGNGSRASADATSPHVPKQFQMLGHQTVLAWSVSAFAADPRFSRIIIVCAEDLHDKVAAMIYPHDVIFAIAGRTRTESVRSGLAHVEADANFIFIHDAARPGLKSDVLDHLFRALEEGADGAAPTRPVRDALWSVEENNLKISQDRTHLLRVQTPQAFQASKIIGAYGLLGKNDERADDVAVARDAGLTIVSVNGNDRLDKITWPQDFARMTQLLAPPLLPRVGSGLDAHKFVSGDKITLCGVEIAHDSRLAGHSDADVGWHALADAIYGALSAGDIGHHFPPSEARWKGVASSVFLRHAGDMVRASGGVINHVDVTIICEAPKVGPHRQTMCKATADVLGLRLDQVSIKATTTEAMGFTGRREGIAAHANATILLPETFRQATEVHR